MEQKFCSRITLRRLVQQHYKTVDIIQYLYNNMYTNWNPSLPGVVSVLILHAEAQQHIYLNH